MDNYTIAETFTLPSKGKIYNPQISPEIQLRSMTTVEEMRRLSHTDSPYKTLCDIIDACTTSPVELSSYDMHLGDYQFLLHRLRVVTYGTSYPTSSVCPVCGKVNRTVIDLDKDVPLLPYDFEDPEVLKRFQEDLIVTLPKSGKTIKLKFQTPHILDDIDKEERDYNEKNPDNTLNMTYLFTLKHLIDTVDGKKTPLPMLDIFLRGLPMMDSNILLQKASKITDKVGIDTILNHKCSNPKCGAKYKTSFRITNEFFGPSID